ncbi:hypothetical protein [Enterococcus sp. BWR-S5]|uniref:hypothetical protein n=1 Tax=Enterococcus sp. BWR-S5 TaxID=2787714 RepID=UPI0019222108|nr:hypothetical protein [Enterococcus sp. BWR-S5]MBL1225071.1 hypothetical protein [Enterococcus sp. BWR-S5]
MFYNKIHQVIDLVINFLNNSRLAGSIPVLLIKTLTAMQQPIYLLKIDSCVL